MTLAGRKHRVIGRRAVLGGVLTTLLAPYVARAKRPARVARLGVLLFSDPGSDPNTRAMRDALRGHGYVEGQNLVIEYRYAEGHPERLRDLAADLVRTKPDVIFVLGGDVASFATAATSTIPIVVSISGDPIRSKLVTTLAAPGGNVTGVTFLTSELAGKRLQLLKQAVPRVARVAVVWSPDHPDDELNETQIAGRALGVQVLSSEMRDAAELDGALKAAVVAGADGFMVVPSRLTVRLRNPLIEFAARHKLPLAGGWGLWAESGALLSYGPDTNVMVRRATGYVDRILKGAKPAELPFEQPTKFEFVVNLKTARTLGLAISQTLLLQADRVIR
jgi:putative ABC transport system substrate-binding protein